MNPWNFCESSQHLASAGANKRCQETVLLAVRLYSSVNRNDFCGQVELLMIAFIPIGDLQASVRYLDVTLTLARSVVM